ncbi:uncharacterized mitochondrial protein AtMg00820-like [Hevea brasiliensis]|uniref:uncharacterized mitochondrial protein AtMg00820-like n=1 Tax=Hevea brasiliensis TaxID=3981 RepID=UPI0025E0318F|nr:uncharacterized mitochondrial protein AtMg00820-like [Hevea brasiliensis]
MLHAKNVPGSFWAEAMRTAAFVINRLPQQRLCFLSPFEKLWNMKPTLSSDEIKDSNDDNDVEQGMTQNSWQTSVYQQLSEEGETDKAEVPTEQSQPRRLTRIRKPNLKYANATIIEEEVAKEPETFEEASQNFMWIEAMEAEITALERNQTWELVPKLRDVKPISCKWIYKIKQCTNGSIERFKARLVARGFSQQYGLDYDEKFSPVAKLTTVRILLAFAANKD